MSHFLSRTARTFGLAFVLATAGNCTDLPTHAADASHDALAGEQPAAALLECDAPVTPQTITSVIGPLGGTLGIGGTRVVIPANAVLAPTIFQLTIPASRLVEISVRAGDAEHFVFEQPVLVSIDYSRCADALSPLSPVAAWHIDETSKALLENMTGVDLRLLHTITFYTGHLSGYAVAD